MVGLWAEQKVDSKVLRLEIEKDKLMVERTAVKKGVTTAGLWVLKTVVWMVSRWE
jgi:hypothetical protein